MQHVSFQVCDFCCLANFNAQFRDLNILATSFTMDLYSSTEIRGKVDCWTPRTIQPSLLSWRMLTVSAPCQPDAEQRLVVVVVPAQEKK